MKKHLFFVIFAVLIVGLSFSIPASADSYSNAMDVFKKSPAVQPFFENAYGYAVFPSIGKAGLLKA